jgi:TatD DNase family protein
MFETVKLIDTHCHLDAAEFGIKQSEIVASAAAVGVHSIVVPAVAATNFTTVHELSQQYSACVPAFGIHPLYVAQAQPQDLQTLREYLATQNPVAVGEIGLDFFVDGYDQARQEYFFVAQLKLAREFNLPVLLHVRRAQDVILKHLRRIKVVGGIAHAFNGSRQQADEFIKLGFKLGFGGAMTYPRALRMRELAATLPLESIVLETDAPDIPPDFLVRSDSSGLGRFINPSFILVGENANDLLHKKIINLPEYLPYIAQTLADLRGMSMNDIATATTDNAVKVLPLLSAG